jgi:hypothetical protein
MMLIYKEGPKILKYNVSFCVYSYEIVSLQYFFMLDNINMLSLCTNDFAT